MNWAAILDSVNGIPYLTTRSKVKTETDFDRNLFEEDDSGILQSIAQTPGDLWSGHEYLKSMFQRVVQSNDSVLYGHLRRCKRVSQK